MTQFKHLKEIEQHRSPFGSDRFGVWAERFAVRFGSPRFIVVQTLMVILWIALNIVGMGLAWDPYPFILLNLMFSTQASYAAPLILLASTRQAGRDKAISEADAKHRQEIADQHTETLNKLVALQEQNNELTEQVADLTQQLHNHFSH